MNINPTIIEQLGAKAAPIYDGLKDEIDPKEHAIFDRSKRPTKTVRKPDLDSQGKPRIDTEGKVVTRTESVDPTRLALPLQNIIVTRRVAFMNLGKVKLFAEPADETQERAFALLQRLRDNNKVAYKESEIATLLNKELQAAKLWYSVDALDANHWGSHSAVKKDFKLQVLAPSKGDKLLPVFDKGGDLIYFGRGYIRTADVLEVMTAGGSAAEAEKEIECLDIYSKDKLYRFEKGDQAQGELSEGGWTLVGTVDLPYGKIPVIYYSKDQPIWANVQPLIERLETCLSDLADANSYNASPLLAFLNVDGAQAQTKGEQGKAVALKGDKADVKYVTWDQVINAVEFEVGQLVNFIYSLTQTPNISFEEMKELGDLSGVAFDRIFMDAHLASRQEIEGGYGEMLQRSVNLEKALLASMDTALSGALQSLSVSVEVPAFKLDDIQADVTLASQALAGGLVSKETAIGLSGLVTNVQEELERIKKEVRVVTDGGGDNA